MNFTRPTNTLNFIENGRTFLAVFCNIFFWTVRDDKEVRGLSGRDLRNRLGRAIRAIIDGKYDGSLAALALFTIEGRLRQLASRNPRSSCSTGRTVGPPPPSETPL